MSLSQTRQTQRALRESHALPLEDRIVRAFGIVRDFSRETGEYVGGFVLKEGKLVDVSRKGKEHNEAVFCLLTPEERSEFASQDEASRYFAAKTAAIAVGSDGRFVRVLLQARPCPEQVQQIQRLLARSRHNGEGNPTLCVSSLDARTGNAYEESVRSALVSDVARAVGKVSRDAGLEGESRS